MDDKIKTFEEFEMRLRDEPIPKAYFHPVIDQKEWRGKRKPFYLRASFIAIFLSLFITVSVAGAVRLSGWKFYNGKENQIFEIEEMAPEEEEAGAVYDAILSKHASAIEQIENSIPKGKFVYFLDVEGYEKIGLTSVALLMNPEKINDTAQIPDSIQKSLQLQNNIQNKYILTGGSISYMPQGRDEAEEVAETLFTEAKEKKVPYITKDGKLSSEVSHVELVYETNEKTNGQSVQINIRPVPAEKMVTNQDFTGYTQFKENGVDFLYSESSQEMLFIKEGQAENLLVSIFMNQKADFSKEELLSVAEYLIAD